MSIKRSIVCDRCGSIVAAGLSVALARADAALLGAQRRGAQDLCALCAAAEDDQNDADVGGCPAPPHGRDQYVRALTEDLVELIAECVQEAVDSRLDERRTPRSRPAEGGSTSPAQAFTDRMSR